MSLAVFEQINRPHQIMLNDLTTARYAINTGKDARVRRCVDDPIGPGQSIDVAGSAKGPRDAPRCEDWRKASLFTSLPGLTKLSQPKISAPSRLSRMARARVLPVNPQIPVTKIRMASVDRW